MNDPRERASNPAETLDTLAALLRQRLEGTTDDGDGSRARAAPETQVGAVAPDAADATGDGGSPLGVPGYEGAVTVGRGPFATVYVARQRASDRTVAIKVYSALSVVERSWRRFRHECQQIASLAGHPGIWPVHNAGLTDQGRPYVTMDYAARGSLAERLRAGGPLRWQHGVEVGSRLADALEAAHDLGVRHGSIKPENVLFTPSGDPALADFGATTVPEGSAIAPALLAARRPHAAPEVLDGRPRQRASDIYALGSCLFTALAGEPPFSRPSDAPLPTVVAGSDHHTVPDLRPRGVPDAVCRALERALAHDPGDRHPTAADLRDDLRRAARVDASPEFDHSTPSQRGGVIKRGAPSGDGRRPDAQVQRTTAAPSTPPAQERQEKRPLPAGIRPAAFAVALLLGAGVVSAAVLARRDPPTSTVAVDADLALSVSATQEPVEVGQDVAYDLRVVNRGPSEATGVVVTGGLPRGATFIADRPRGRCRPTGERLTCTLGRIAKDGTARMALVLTPVETGTLVHRLRVAGRQRDPNTGDNATVTTTWVNRCPSSPPLNTEPSRCGATRT